MKQSLAYVSEFCKNIHLDTTETLKRKYPLDTLGGDIFAITLIAQERGRFTLPLHLVAKMITILYIRITV